MALSLQRALEASLNRQAPHLIVNISRPSEAPRWTVVKKVSWIVWLIRTLFCCSPYNKSQTDKRKLFQAIQDLPRHNLNQEVHCSIVQLSERLGFTSPPESVNALSKESVETLRFRNFFHKKSVKWMSGTPSTTLVGLHSLVQLGHPPALLPIDILIEKGVVPLSGAFGNGIWRDKQFNRRSVSGTQGPLYFWRNLSYATAEQHSLPVIKRTEISLICDLNPTTFNTLRIKIAIYRLLTLDLLNEQERGDFVKKLENRLSTLGWFSTAKKRDLLACIEVLKKPSQVYKTPPAVYQAFTSPPFPVVFGSTRLSNSRLQKMERDGGHTLVKNGAELGKDLDFAVTANEHVQTLKDFFAQIGLADKVSVFAISFFKENLWRC